MHTIKSPCCRNGSGLGGESGNSVESLHEGRNVWQRYRRDLCTMVSAFKNAWGAFVQAPRHFLLFGFLAFLLTSISPLNPIIAFFSTYILIPALYMSVSLLVAKGSFNLERVQTRKSTYLGAWRDSGALGIILLIQQVLSTLILSLVFVSFVDPNTLETLNLIFSNTQNDPVLMEDMLINDIQWDQLQYLLIALLLLGIALLAACLQAWHIFVFERCGVFVSMWRSLIRLRFGFGTWVALSCLLVVVLMLNGMFGGVLRIFTFPLFALTHYFLYKNMNS